MKRRGLILLLMALALLLNALLTACGETDERPARPPQLSITPPTFAPLIDTLPPSDDRYQPQPAQTAVPATPIPTDELPTPAAGITPAKPLPTFNIFVTPPPLATFEAYRNQPDRASIATNIKLENLQRINGLPVIPYVDVNLKPQQNLQRLPNYGPNGRPRVGLQIGHLNINELPDEWASLRGQTGASSGDFSEVQVASDIARRVAAFLQSRGVAVDLLPATVPPGYTADVFVSLHVDGVGSSGPTGFKLARGEGSAIPKTDDALVAALYNQYEAATGMRRDGSITANMTGYYCFNGVYKQYAISKITPGALIELGFLTNPNDRAYLTQRPDDAARGVANGIIVFLNGRPPLAQREQPANLMPAVEARQAVTPVYSAPTGGNIIAYVTQKQLFLRYDNYADSYGVDLPVLNVTGFIRKTDAGVVNVQR